MAWRRSPETKLAKSPGSAKDKIAIASETKIAAKSPRPASKSPNALPCCFTPPHSRVALMRAPQNNNIVEQPQKAYR